RPLFGLRMRRRAVVPVTGASVLSSSAPAIGQRRPDPHAHGVGELLEHFALEVVCTPIVAVMAVARSCERPTAKMLRLDLGDLAELGLVELIVETAPGQKLLVTAGFGDSTAVHHDDLVRAADGRQPVG